MRVLLCMSCLNHASFCLLTISRSGSSGATRNLILLCTEKFLHALGFVSLDPFLRVGNQGPCLTAIEEDGGDKRLVQLELASDPV